MLQLPRGGRTRPVEMICITFAMTVQMYLVLTGSPLLGRIVGGQETDLNEHPWQVKRGGEVGIGDREKDLLYLILLNW